MRPDIKPAKSTPLPETAVTLEEARRYFRVKMFAWMREPERSRAIELAMKNPEGYGLTITDEPVPAEPERQHSNQDDGSDLEW